MTVYTLPVSLGDGVNQLVLRSARDFLGVLPVVFYSAVRVHLSEAIAELDARGSEVGADERRGMQHLVGVMDRYAKRAFVSDLDLLALAWFLRDCADAQIEAMGSSDATRLN